MNQSPDQEDGMYWFMLAGPVTEDEVNPTLIVWPKGKDSLFFKGNAMYYC